MLWRHLSRLTGTPCQAVVHKQAGPAQEGRPVKPVDRCGRWGGVFHGLATPLESLDE